MKSVIKRIFLQAANKKALNVKYTASQSDLSSFHVNVCGNIIRNFLGTRIIYKNIILTPIWDCRTYNKIAFEAKSTK